MEDYGLPPQGPPSYALESSSSEDDFYDEDGLQRRQKPQRQTQAEASIQVEGQVKTGTNVVFLIGEAGEHVARGVQNSTEDASATVTVNGQQMASIVSQPTQTTLVFLSQELKLVNLFPLASALMKELAPTRTTTITSYHLPSYLTDVEHSTPPILYLESQPSAEVKNLVDSGNLTAYTPPNLLHGLASMLVTLSTLSGVPSLLLLLPSLAPPHPLNGPWPTTSSSDFYDAGPTGLSNPNEILREVQGKLRQVASTLSWTWWRSDQAGGNGFAWLEQERKQRRKQEMRNYSMYM